MAWPGRRDLTLLTQQSRTARRLSFNWTYKSRESKSHKIIHCNLHNPKMLKLKFWQNIPRFPAEWASHHQTSSYCDWICMAIREIEIYTSKAKFSFPAEQCTDYWSHQVWRKTASCQVLFTLLISTWRWGWGWGWWWGWGWGWGWGPESPLSLGTFPPEAPERKNASDCRSN